MTNDLSTLAEELYFPLRLSIGAATRYQYQLALRDFERFLGRAPALSDLTDDTLTMWMSRKLGEGLSPATVRERIGRVATLWTWLAKRGHVKTFPTFQKPKPVDTLPTALNEDQLRALFRSAAKERGSVGGIDAGLWWTSFLAFIWNSAERKSAALAVKVAWVDLPNATVTIPPDVRKGGRKWAVYHLWPETLLLVRRCIELAPQREHVWPVNFCSESYYTRYNRILKDAGLPVSRKYKTHALRCSHATWLAVMGGNPTKALGHDSQATTDKHYIDQRMIQSTQPKLFIPWQPPEPPKAA